MFGPGVAPDLTKIVEGMFSVEERKHSKTGRNAEDKQRNTCAEKHPSSWSVDQWAMENKDIPINHDSSRQEAVEDVDEETKTWKEPAEGRTHPHHAESENSRNIGQAQDTVGQDHQVEEGQAALPDGVLDQSNIDDDNGCHNSKPKYLKNSRSRLPKDEICFQNVEFCKCGEVPVVHVLLLQMQYSTRVLLPHI